MHVPGAARSAGRGLVGVDGRCCPQQLADPVHEPAVFDQRGCPGPDASHPPSGSRDPGELAQQHRGPVNRNVMAAGQVRSLGAGLRPDAGPRPHVRRQVSLGDLPTARALLGLRHILPDLRLRRRLDVGDLMTALRRHRFPGQIQAAPPAHRRRAVKAFIRVIDQAHRHPGITRLLSRPPLPPLPQRPVRAPLLIRAVRRRGT